MHTFSCSTLSLLCSSLHGSCNDVITSLCFVTMPYAHTCKLGALRILLPSAPSISLAHMLALIVTVCFFVPSCLCRPGGVPVLSYRHLEHPGLGRSAWIAEWKRYFDCTVSADCIICRCRALAWLILARWRMWSRSSLCTYWGCLVSCFS